MKQEKLKVLRLNNRGSSPQFLAGRLFWGWSWSAESYSQINRGSCLGIFSCADALRKYPKPPANTDCSRLASPPVDLVGKKSQTRQTFKVVFYLVG
jgi:hypothetical protein